MEVLWLGFCSFGDGSFELIIQAPNGEETTLEGKLRVGQLEVIDKILPTCVFVKREVHATSNNQPND